MASRLLRSSWPAFIATVLGLSWILVHHGVTARDLATFGAYLVLLVAFPGVFCWRVLLVRLHADETRRPTWFEDLALGTIFGFGLQLPVYLLGLWIGRPRLFLVIPIVIIVVSLSSAEGRRVWTMPTSKVDARVSWALGAVIVYGVAWLARYVFILRPMSLPTYRTPSVDETFDQAIISQFLHRFPPELPYLLHTPLEYHWFVHAQLAANHWATGIDSVVMLRRLMPTATLALTVLGLGAVALRLGRRPVAAVVAPALLVVGASNVIGPHFHAGGYLEPFLSARYVSNPSQAYGFMLALPAIMLVLEVLRADRRPGRGVWTALLLAVLALSGSTGTFLPLFACGAIGVLLITAATRRTVDRTVLLLAAILVAVSAFAQLVVMRDTWPGLRIDPLLTPRTLLRWQGLEVSPTAEVVLVVVLVVAWLEYGAGAVGLLRNRLWADRRAVWMAGTVLAGLLVAFLLFAPGLSNLWYQRSVAPLVVLLSAWGLAVLLPDPVPRRLGAGLVLLAATSGLGAYLLSRAAERGDSDPRSATYHELLATAILPVGLLVAYLAGRLVMSWAKRPGPGPLVIVAVLLGLSLQHAFALAVDTVAAPDPTRKPPPNQFAPGGAHAAAWVRNRSRAYDVIATNVHCRLPDEKPCDNRNFWISAYTQRRVVIEGWGYPHGTDANYLAHVPDIHLRSPDPVRLRINDAAFQHPSAESVRRLVDLYGVRFLFVSRQYPVDLPGLRALPDLLSQRFANRNYVVFRVHR